MPKEQGDHLPKRTYLRHRRLASMYTVTSILLEPGAGVPDTIILIPSSLALQLQLPFRLRFRRPHTRFTSEKLCAFSSDCGSHCAAPTARQVLSGVAGGLAWPLQLVARQPARLTLHTTHHCDSSLKHWALGISALSHHFRTCTAFPSAMSQVPLLPCARFRRREPLAGHPV